MNLLFVGANTTNDARYRQRRYARCPLEVLPANTYSLCSFSSPVRGAKKKASQKTCFFLFNPKDWYEITRRVYGIRRKATAWHHASACILLRIDYIQHFVLMICNSFGIDDIHAVCRDFTSCIFVLRTQRKADRKMRSAFLSFNLMS